MSQAFFICFYFFSFRFEAGKLDLEIWNFKILGGLGLNGNLQRYLWEALRIREAKVAEKTLLNHGGE